MPSRLKITLDTNTLPLERALDALGNRPADLAVTSVTAREVHGTRWAPELHSLDVVPEMWVMDETPLDMGALASQSDADLFEATIAIITNGAFPRQGSRENLTPQQTRQMRDAMIFCTHVREGRDIFVTNDVTAFGEEGSVQCQRFAALSSTRVMTLAEFERSCAPPR